MKYEDPQRDYMNRGFLKNPKTCIILTYLCRMNLFLKVISYIPYPYKVSDADETSFSSGFFEKKNI